MMIHRIAFLGLVISVVAAPATLVATPVKATTQWPDPGESDGSSDPGGDDDGHPICSHYVFESVTGGSAPVGQEVARLFNGDPQLQIGKVPLEQAKQQLEDRCGFRPSNRTLLYAQSDFAFPSPQQATWDWNNYWFDRFVLTLRSRTNRDSFVPEGADTTDVGWIKDAHATIYSLTPSTELYVKQDRFFYQRVERTYYSSETRLQALSDFRIEVPEDDTTGPNQSIYSVQSVTTTGCARKDIPISTHRCYDQEDMVTDRVRSFPMNQRIGDEEFSKLQLVSYVRVTGQVKNKTCTDWNDSTQSCDGDWNVSTESRTFETILTDERQNLEKRTPADVTIRAAQFPDGEYKIEVTSHGRFAGLDLTDKRALVWNYRFFGQMAPYWEDASILTASGTEAPDQHFHPLQSKAIPSPDGPMMYGNGLSGHITSVEWWGDSLPAPELRPSIAISSSGRYQRLEAVRMAGFETFDPSKFKLYGMVNGVTATTSSQHLTVKPVQQVGTSTLELSLINSSGPRPYVRATLTNQDGEPIHTAARNGSLVVDDRRIETNASGMAVLQGEQSSTLRVEYKPARWHNTSLSKQPYLGDYDELFIGPGMQSYHDLAALIVQFLVGIVLPLMLVAWFINESIETAVWPPWKVFTQ